MRGPVGIVIGLIVGAGGMYLALRPPWGGGATTTPAPIDAGVVSVAPSDAGPAGKKKKKKRRPRNPGTTAAGDLPTIDGTFGEDGEGEYYEETEPLVELSAAQRALEWRGDDVTLPPTKIDMSGGKEARPLDDSEINATIGGQSDGVRKCVVTSASNTDLRATIMVKMIVGGDGRVTKSRIQAPRYLFEKGLLTCVQRSLGRMKFPSTGAPTSVSLPVTLG